MGKAISRKEKEDLISLISAYLINAEPEYKFDLPEETMYLFNDPTRHAQYIVLISVSKERVFNGRWPRYIEIGIKSGTSRFDLYDILERLADAERKGREEGDK